MNDYGYGTVSKMDASSGEHKVDILREEYTYSSINDMIQGRVPGVYVRKGSITIRGVSSINNQGQPLFVVDGVISSSIDGINPMDVNTITALKGPETAIYGSRGALGVIVITTKKGSSKK